MIAAIILAAGESRRMGQPKMLLPWGKMTVIEHVVKTFLKAGLEEIIVVTGGSHEQVVNALNHYPIRSVHNEDSATGEMLSSLQCGLRKMQPRVRAALIGLGDQPQVQEGSIQAICDAYQASASNLIVPSYQLKRGHPWLVARSLWSEILALQPPKTSRDFINDHSDQIQYLNLNTPSILEDLDTLEAYQKSRP